MSDLKIFYAAGPGDVIGTYHYWKKHQNDPAILWYPDRGQFYDLVESLQAEALVISCNARKDCIQEAPFKIINLPKKTCSGLMYDINQIWYGLKLCFHALKFRPNIAIVEEGMAHWFVWNLLAWSGVKIILSIKCTLWPICKPLR